MQIKDLSKYTNAEKILLAEQIWDSISKKDVELSKDTEQELDYRLQLLEEGKTELYTMNDVKKHIAKIRKK